MGMRKLAGNAAKWDCALIASGCAKIGLDTLRIVLEPIWHAAHVRYHPEGVITIVCKDLSVSVYVPKAVGSAGMSWMVFPVVLLEGAPNDKERGLSEGDAGVGRTIPLPRGLLGDSKASAERFDAPES